MARFEDIGGGEVRDNVTDLIWTQAPTARMQWDELVIPSGKRVPTLEEIQSLLEGQKANLAECNAAFGAGNLPTDWFWVHKIDPAQQSVWEAGPQTNALAEALSLEKPGHVAAYFVWLGRQPANRRLERALCRFVE